MPKKKEQSKTEAKGLVVPIRWNMPDAIITRFASNMLVQILENEFKLLFFETKPEIRLGPGEPPPTEVRADCVASVIITADKMPRVIEALQKQYAIYQAKGRNSLLSSDN